MGRRESKKEWGGKYSNKGHVDFTLTGVVNDITENPDREEDYVYFFIENQLSKNNICLFPVTVSWELPQLEEGETVNIFGVMRTWNTEGRGPKIELVAQQLEKVVEEEKEVKKGRRE